MDRYAAVLIPIFADAPHEVVFIERARHLRRHAGEIAFPGGAVDVGDADDHLRTALREVDEEIGIPPHAITVVGRLPPLRQRSKVFTVTPFVGVVDPSTIIRADGNEVVATHRVPLAAILAPDAVHAGVEVQAERRIETLHFDYAGIHVWGLTASILGSFVEHYGVAASPLRAALDERLRR
jgi:8-oxo-dGTP pyrophosphatase MutT (NUDIX family)